MYVTAATAPATRPIVAKRHVLRSGGGRSGAGTLALVFVRVEA